MVTKQGLKVDPNDMVNIKCITILQVTTIFSNEVYLQY